MTHPHRSHPGTKPAMTHAEDASQPATPFLGLPPFLRMSITGVNFASMGQDMLARAWNDATDANLWMNLAIVMMCLGRRELGLTMQAQALKLKRVYYLAAAKQPAKLR